MSEVIRVGINGAAGRMGQRIVALAHADAGLQVVAAYESSSCGRIGDDAGEIAGIGSIGVPVQLEVTDAPDVIIDFSLPDGAVAIAELCGERRIPLVAATTGLNQEQRDTVLTAAQTASVVMAPNMSLAVNLTMKLVRDAARALKNSPAVWMSRSLSGTTGSRKMPPAGPPCVLARLWPRKWGRLSMFTGVTGVLGCGPETKSATIPCEPATILVNIRSCSG